MRYEHLCGIPFVHGTDDCYSIVRQFFLDNFDIHLTDYARPDGWWDSGLNLYMNYFRDEGFESVDVPPHQAKPADCFLLALQSVDANHAGVYLGNGQILHHYRGRLSEVVPLSTMWRRPCAIVRHKSVVINEPVATMDVMEHILPHKRARLQNEKPPS